MICTRVRRFLTGVSLCVFPLLVGCSGGEKPPSEKGEGAAEAAGVRRDGGVEEALVALVGAHARVVWMWHQSEAKSDTYGNGKQHLLAGFSTEDGKGVRVLLEGRGNYARPLLTPDGETVLYTDKRIRRKDGKKYYKPKIYRLPWGGGEDEVKEVAKGYAADVWRDPATGTDWVYAVEAVVPSDAAILEAKRLVRFQLDEPGVREVLYEGRISVDNLQVSRDGTLAAGLFPWPHGGVIELEKKTWHRTTGGCWTSLAPDDSGISWVFDGAHRNVRMFSADRSTNWTTAVDGAPGVDGLEVYHPRWSNHPRIFAITGPYGKAAAGENPISKGGAKAEVCIGRFSPDLRSVEAWVKLTANKMGDFFPDIWVSGGEKESLDLAAVGVVAGGVAGMQTAASDRPAVFRWDNNNAENRTEGRTCLLHGKGVARFGRGFEMLLDGGWFAADGASSQALADAWGAGDGIVFGGAIAGAGDGVISAVILPDGKPSLALRYRGGQVVCEVALQEGVPFSLAADVVLSGKPVVAVIGGLGVQIFVGGEEVAAGQFPSPPRASWTGGKLQFGGGGGSASLTVANVAIYAGGLSGGEVQTLFTQPLPTDPPQRIRFRGKLVEAAGVPDAASLDTYTRALVDYTYEVEEVLEGDYPDPKIVVWHWALLDRRLASNIPRNIGSVYELTVEPTSARPELAGERRTETTSEGLLEPYYDVAPPPGLAPAR